MLDTILITLLIVAICIVLLGVKVFFVKGGRFPNGHVSGNKAMRDRGINYEEIKLPHERSGSSRTDRFICSMCRQY